MIKERTIPQLFKNIGIPISVIFLEILFAGIIGLTNISAVYVTMITNVVFSIGAGVWYCKAKFNRKLAISKFSEFSTRRFIFLVFCQLPIWLMVQLVANYLVINNVIEYKSLSDTLGNTPTSHYLLLSLFFAPIAEELLFRGVIFNFIRRSFGFIIASFVSAIVFGLMHGNIPQGYVTIILGFYYALVYQYSNRIWVVISLHIIANMIDAMSILIRIPIFFLEPWFFITGNILIIIGLILWTIYLYKRPCVKSVDDIEDTNEQVIRSVVVNDDLSL